MALEYMLWLDVMGCEEGDPWIEDGVCGKVWRGCVWLATFHSI